MRAKARKLRDLIKLNAPIACPCDTIKTAAELMAKGERSAIAVLSDGKLVGVLSESAITEKVVAKGLNAASVSVEELMDANPVRICDDRDVENAALVLRARGARAVAIQDMLGRFVGILTDRELCGYLPTRSVENKS